jgi:hypothetical protein
VGGHQPLLEFLLIRPQLQGSVHPGPFVQLASAQKNAVLDADGANAAESWHHAIGQQIEGRNHQKIGKINGH